MKVKVQENGYRSGRSTLSVFLADLLILHTNQFRTYIKECYISVACIKSLRNGKTLGLECIPANVWKTDALTKPLLEVSNKAEIWDRSGIMPFLQKDELRYTSSTEVSVYQLLPPTLRNKQNNFWQGHLVTYSGSEKNISKNAEKLLKYDTSCCIYVKF